MNIIQEYFPSLTLQQQKQFAMLGDLYREWNGKINVISRKDIDNLYVNHVLHSLGIAKVISFKAGTNILDIGTGGGFPGIPLAILFPQSTFHLVDSIGKKIMVVNEVAKALGLENVTATHARAEELLSKFPSTKNSFDFMVSRAVSSMSDLYKWSFPLMKKDGFNDLANGMLLLKGGELEEERQILRKKAMFFSLRDFFKEEFFETKKVVYVPL